MVEGILRSAGLSTGLYTSPHLHSYCERIRIRGEPISEERFAGLAAEVRSAVGGSTLGGRSLVTFDLLTAMAFLAFREEGVQVQVVEVGLGGRLDSTNVFPTTDVCVLSPISLEHTHILGHTVEAIAGEKAAIIRPGCTAVLAPQRYAEVEQVVGRRVGGQGAVLVRVADGYRWRVLSHDLSGQTVLLSGPRGDVRVRLPLLGVHQVENAATALACVDALAERGVEVSQEVVERGLAAVVWPGRLEVLRRRPPVVVDGAHNRESARRLREALRDYFSARPAFLIIGTLADKDVAGLAEELAPAAAEVMAVQASHPRAMPAQRVAEAFAGRGVPAEVEEGVAKALERVMAVAGRQGLICVVAGSLFTAAEARQALLGVPAVA